VTAVTGVLFDNASFFGQAVVERDAGEALDAALAAFAWVLEDRD
jgi:hypothetical protein